MAKFSRLFGPALVFLLTNCTLETAILLADAGLVDIQKTTTKIDKIPERIEQRV
jgi:hypothetical protein